MVNWRILFLIQVVTTVIMVFVHALGLFDVSMQVSIGAVLQYKCLLICCEEGFPLRNHRHGE